MKQRLEFILAAMVRLQENEWVRSEGNQIFQEAKIELTDVIATYVEATAPPAPPPAMVVMTAEQVEALVDGVVARLPEATDAEAIVAAVRDEIEKSEVSVLAAVASLAQPQ